MSVHLVPTIAEHWAMYGSGLHTSNRLTACGRHSGGLQFSTRVDAVTCKTCLRVAPTLARPAVHRCLASGVTAAEVAVLDCGSGCKRRRCDGCGAEFDAHDDVYGCTGRIDAWRKRVTA